MLLMRSILALSGPSFRAAVAFDGCLNTYTNPTDCDVAWADHGLTCEHLNSEYGWDCTGCACLGDGATSCIHDYSDAGAADCDAAWIEAAVNCEGLSQEFGWDCAGCSCPGDAIVVGNCVDSPQSWSDIDPGGPYGCDVYASQSWCTSSGDHGPGWNFDWGSIEDFASRGGSAFEACCVCGGGELPPTPAPTPQPPTPVPTFAPTPLPTLACAYTDMVSDTAAEQPGCAESERAHFDDLVDNLEACREACREAVAPYLAFHHSRRCSCYAQCSWSRSWVDFESHAVFYACEALAAVYRTVTGSTCPPGSDIETESECAEAAQVLGFDWAVQGNPWNGIGQHRYCLFADDGKQKVYFNSAGEAAGVSAYPSYASLCSRKEAPCSDIEVELTAEAMQQHCAGQGQYSEDRSPSAVGCDPADTDTVRFALANKMFMSCSAPCLYDVFAPARTSWSWDSDELCWVADDVCLRFLHDQLSHAVDRAKQFCKVSTFFHTAVGKRCPGGRDITSSQECKVAADYLGLVFHSFDVSDLADISSEYRYCFYAQSQKRLAFFEEPDSTLPLEADTYLSLCTGAAICSNSDGGALDARGMDCLDGYPLHGLACGDYDDADFTAADMCCKCVVSDAPTPTPPPTPAVCYDVEGSARDSGEANCEMGYLDSLWCGYYDDTDFSADDLCCVCGGGSTESSALPWYTDAGGDMHCVDTTDGAVDRVGFVCDDYRVFPSWCEIVYAGNDADFSAGDMCCTCGGGELQLCFHTDGTATDRTGEGCSTFSPGLCHTDLFDDTDFTAMDMCCACGGGDPVDPTPAPTLSPTPAPTRAPTPSPTLASSTITDTTTWTSTATRFQYSVKQAFEFKSTGAASAVTLALAMFLADTHSVARADVTVKVSATEGGFARSLDSNWQADSEVVSRDLDSIELHMQISSAITSFSAATAGELLAAFQGVGLTLDLDSVQVSQPRLLFGDEPAGTTAAEDALQTMRTTTTVGQLPFCLQGSEDFDAGFGSCRYYAPGQSNYKHCDTDQDAETGSYAHAVCKECRKCIPASSAVATESATSEADSAGTQASGDSTVLAVGVGGGVVLVVVVWIVAGRRAMRIWRSRRSVRSASTRMNEDTETPRSDAPPPVRKAHLGMDVPMELPIATEGATGGFPPQGGFTGKFSNREMEYVTDIEPALAKHTG